MIIIGNRAVIATKKQDGKGGIGVYVHWCGGRNSVQAFLTYCKLQGFRTPETDNYGWARLAQVIGNYFSDGLSVGVGELDTLDTDNGNNGLYVIKDWEIVDRQYYQGRETTDNNKVLEMLLDIDRRQPQSMQLGTEKIKSSFPLF